MESVKSYGIHDFTKTLMDVQNASYTTSESRGVPVIQQTQRNNLRKQLMKGLENTIRSLVENEVDGNVANVHITSEGIAVEVQNPSVYSVEDGNGFISFVIDIKMKDLLYDALSEANAYENECAEKAQKAQKAQEAKQAKIAADKARRAAREAKV